MARIWLPAETDFTLALREPNLLVPGRKPVSEIRLKDNFHHRVAFGYLCNNLLDVKELTNATFIGSNVSVSSFAGYGTGWIKTATNDTSYVDTNNTLTGGSPSDGSHSDVIVFISNAVAQKSYAFGTVNSGTGFIDDLLVNSANESYSSGSLEKFLRGDATSSSIKGNTGDIGIDDGRVHCAVWSYDGVQTFSCAVDGKEVPVTQTITNDLSGTIPLNAQNDYWIFTRNLRGASSGGAVDGFGLFLCLRLSGKLSPAERVEISKNPFGALFESANDTPYLFPVAAAGGGVSGTGDLVGAGSEVIGTGTRSVTGTGALEGQGAQVVGTATRTITGTGALVGQGSDVAGTGATGGTHTGVGDLVAAGSEIVGVGERTVTGTGALVAQGSAVAGVGERTVTGSGDLVGAGAEVSGSGAIGGITTGTGDLVGAGSEVVGTGLRTVTGSGALVAQGSAVTGTAERTIVGAGALVGSGSEIVGAGVGGDVTTGAGALVGQGSAVTGTGTRTITGVGELVAAGSIIVGSGLRTITGSGALVGVGSEIVGTYVATIVEPSLFQSAAETIIDVFAAAHGQTITLALDSGTVTITGFMRKRPKDWSTPDGKMRGSGWQIVCKGWEISSSDLEGMSGKRATVDGDAYYIVSATPKTSGTLVLDVGYAN